jgi:hypothetical protein
LSWNINIELLFSLKCTRSSTPTINSHIKRSTKLFLVISPPSRLFNWKTWISTFILQRSRTRHVRSGQHVSEFGHWCWAIRPGSQRSNLSLRYSTGLRSGLCAGQLSSSTLISTNHFCMDLACAWGHSHAETGKAHPQTVTTELEAHNRLECHCML